MNALARTRHHLRNSLLALSAVCAIFGTCLLVARPPMVPVAEAAAKGLDASQVPVTGALLEAACEAGQAAAASEDESSPPRGPRRRSRQPLAMPYFSFAARS